MALLYLVRHGQALGRSKGIYDETDPPLDETGSEQAKLFAQDFASRDPLAIITSPKRRARETASPLEKIWDQEAAIEAGVTEIVAPFTDPHERGRWILNFMGGLWSEAPVEQQCWKSNVVRALVDLPQDAVIFTHFMVINAAVAEATATDQVLAFRPNNCSVTVLRSVGEELRLVSLGAEKPLEDG